jgi:hypothetical protein
MRWQDSRQPTDISKLYFETQRDCKHFYSFVESVYCRSKGIFQSMCICVLYTLAIYRGPRLSPGTVAAMAPLWAFRRRIRNGTAAGGPITGRDSPGCVFAMIITIVITITMINNVGAQARQQLRAAGVASPLPEPGDMPRRACGNRPRRRPAAPSPAGGRGANGTAPRPAGWPGRRAGPPTDARARRSRARVAEVG